MIHITDKKDCCGCNACGDICTHGAITFVTDVEGFWYPEIDENKCTDCGLCEKVCPIINIQSIPKPEMNTPIVYGGYHKNIAIRFDSTSGGLFSALANAMYRENGYVSGAVYTEDFSVVNYISNNKKDLVKLRSSKYLQSNAIGLYAEIKRLLLAGEKVLACGSPCQMAALRTYLRKEYENLIIVDFLCRATNSPKVYKKYLESLESRYNSKIVSVKAKNKDKGWRSLARKVVFENGEVYYGTGHEDDYRRGYHLNVYERPSCYNCQFKSIPRTSSDITLGDFWGIEKVCPSLDKNLGTSLIMINTKKGGEFFDKIKNKLEYKEFHLNDILHGNRSAILGTISYPPQIDRKVFFQDLDLMPFDGVARKHFPLNEIKNNKNRIKEKIKTILVFLREIKNNPTALCKFVYFNFIRKKTRVHFLNGDYFLPLSHTALDVHKNALIHVKNGIFRFGVKKNRKSKMETRLFIDEGGVLEIRGRNLIRNGSDIQIFAGATLSIGRGAMNMGLQIVCAEKIYIGDDTRIGRDVWIRDNNGGHSIIQTGYTNTAPVIIGNNVWICSNVSIMKGVTIGEGAVVAANSVVNSNVPARCLVSGNPAKVIAENIIWRP